MLLSTGTRSLGRWRPHSSLGGPGDSCGYQGVPVKVFGILYGTPASRPADHCPPPRVLVELPESAKLRRSAKMRVYGRRGPATSGIAWHSATNAVLLNSTAIGGGRIPRDTGSSRLQGVPPRSVRPRGDQTTSAVDRTQRQLAAYAGGSPRLRARPVEDFRTRARPPSIRKAARRSAVAKSPSE
jgi:hypothetical protein